MPVLAVDADANANLGDSLGLTPGETIGSVIASFNGDKINIPPGMTKEAYLDFRLNSVVTESKGLDLVTMGRGEGADCYCYPNLMLRRFLDRLAHGYPYVVMDNEAGMEHLSRRTTQNIDELLLVSDHSIKGVRTIGRLRELLKELRLNIRRESVMINMVPGSIDPAISEEMARLGIEPAVTIPLDEEIRQYDLRQKSLLDLPDTSPAARAVSDFIAGLLKIHAERARR